MDKRPRELDVFTILPKTHLAVIAGAQRKLLSEREARGVSADARSADNLARIEVAVKKAESE
jgi:hypothetical protein